MYDSVENTTQCLFEGYVNAWKQWISKMDDPWKREILRFVFFHYCNPFPYPYHDHVKPWLWKLPKDVNIQVDVYSLKQSKYGITIMVDGIKIWKGYIRTFEQCMEYFTCPKDRHVVSWMKAMYELNPMYPVYPEDDYHMFRNYVYMVSLDVFVSTRYFHHHWQRQLLYGVDS